MTTNWERHFGTPERVADSLREMGGCCVLREFDIVERCCYCRGDELSCYDEILEWLESEVEE